MSSEKIEFVKPPVNSSKDKKLGIFGAALLIMGFFGVAQVPVTASAPPTPPVGATDFSVSGSTITWDGTFLFFQNGGNDYNWISLCTVDGDLSQDDQDCSRDSALVTLSPNPLATSVTFHSDSTYRVTTFDPVTQTQESEDRLFGTETFVVQLLLERVDENDQRTLTKVGLPKFIGPLSPRPTFQPPTTPPAVSATTSRPSTPPIQFEFKGVASASQLLAGNRNFTFEGDKVSDVLAVRVNGKSLPIFNREEDSFDVRLPKLGPGSYSVIIYTATENWEIPGAIVIGKLLPEIRREEIEETFERSSSELPSSAKREIQDMIEATPNLRKITVTAIAFREIVRQDGNRLARARAESALDFIKKLEPGVIIETKLVYRGDIELSSRGLVFRVAQKKS
jgi:hypothetical protein